MGPQGWCPSTYRIYEAPDGGLARIKVPGGVLAPAQLRAVATAAGRWGNGTIDLTSRANLQVRGLDPAAAPALRAALAPVGLSAPTAVREDRRNVMASPAAGFDPGEVLDVRPLVAAVVATLDAVPDDRAVPHKFGVLLDGGGRPSLRGLATDVALGAVRVDARPAGAGPEPGGADGEGTVVLEVALGSALGLGGAGGDTSGAVATIAPGAAPALVVAAAELCAAPPDGGPPRRMADLVAALGPAAVVRALAALLAGVDPGALPVDARAPAGVPSRPAVVGVPDGNRSSPPTRPPRVDHQGELPVPASPPDARGRRAPWVEVRAADGSGGAVTAGRLAALAQAVTAAGLPEVRLTPWRSVVVPVPAGIEPVPVGAVLAAHGWTGGPARDRSGRGSGGVSPTAPGPHPPARRSAHPRAGSLPRPGGLRPVPPGAPAVVHP